ncbi:MAG TPA: sigma-70 family RNA polymerase sigma factor [Bryobacteraceae bacterium]|nr:sigma-70 family RNA polymerase sigma factor [Bryobacteraceae bacterium]
MNTGEHGLENTFRAEAGRIVAFLVRRCGSLDAAEDALQDAVAAALAEWPLTGVPSNAGAWLTTVAYRKLLDRVRRERTRRVKEDELAASFAGVSVPVEPVDREIPDERLRLFFLCCHPSLGVEAQVALTLRMLGGLTTAEIGRAFLLPEATLAQRLVRAKKKIRDAGIPFKVPEPQAIGERLDAVRRVVYLVFNEGYAASGGERLIRGELCAEAIRLARVLRQVAPQDAENGGLLALLLLQDARREGRVDEAGELVTLEEQDRGRWDRGRIDEGTAVLEEALGRRAAGPYQIQAAIAALHAQAARADETDWAQIAGLYERLRTMEPGPVVELNAAVAVGMAFGCEAGLARVEALAGELGEFHLFHATRADLLRRLGRREEARAAYGRAVELAGNEVERRYLERRTVEA